VLAAGDCFSDLTLALNGTRIGQRMILVVLLILFVAAAWCSIQVGRKPQVRRRLVAYWWVWLPIAVIAVVGNEIFDRSRGNANGHPLGDVAVAVVVVGIVFYVSGAVARRKSPDSTT
jgi:uncharacterized membrane protein